MSEPGTASSVIVSEKEASMLQTAREAVFEVSEWHTGEQVARLACLDASSPPEHPDRWKADGKIFSVSHGQHDYFPAYGLDPDHQYRPLAVLADVLRVFNGMKDGWHLAYWFASVNSYLGGKRPLDMIAMEPESVIFAAREEARGVSHA
jgi:hypothetical protein